MCSKCRDLAFVTVIKTVTVQATGEVWTGPVKVYPYLPPEEKDSPPLVTHPLVRRELSDDQLTQLDELAELFLGPGFSIETSGGSDDKDN